MDYYNNDFYDGLNDTRSFLYRQIDTVANLNKLLTTICSSLHNLKNYKINVLGDNSYNVKKYLKDLINKMEFHDSKLQKLIKIKQGFPIYQLGDIENISLIKTLPSMDYKSSVVISNINKELKIIIDLINESITSAQKENDYQTINLLANMQYEFNEFLLDIPQ